MVPTEYTEPEFNLVRLIEFVAKHAIIRRLNGKPGKEIKINPFRPIEMLIPLVQNHRRVTPILYRQQESMPALNNGLYSCSKITWIFLLLGAQQKEVLIIRESQ